MRVPDAPNIRLGNSGGEIRVDRRLLRDTSGHDREKEKDTGTRWARREVNARLGSYYLSLMQAVPPPILPEFVERLEKQIGPDRLGEPIDGVHEDER